MKSIYIFLIIAFTNTLYATTKQDNVSGSFYTIWASEISAEREVSEALKMEKSLAQCVDQSQSIVSNKLGEREEYVDYVISKVSVKRIYDDWSKKEQNGKYLFGSKVECEFTVQLLKAPVKELLKR